MFFLQFTPPPPPFTERVEVRQVVLQVRVLARDGSPILGLDKENFRVLVDGQEVQLASAEWVSTGPGDAATIEHPRPRPRLLAILVQRDLQPARARGLMAFKSYAAQLVESLPTSDWVALILQDSRLHLVQDFTRQHGRVAQLLRHELFRAPPTEGADSDAPRLQPFLPEDQLRRVATREQGLLLVAQALSRLGGDKTLLLLGWGLGRLSYPSVYLPAEYGQAARLLADAQVQVLALDITQADWHTLELGLVQAAEDTGGIYAKTHVFPQQAVRRVLGALAGYYELSFPRPPLPEGVHRVEVRLVGARGLVLCRPTFADETNPALP